MGPQPESGWFRQRAGTEVDDVGKQEDGVEREEAESQLFGKFPEGFRVKMGRFRNRGVAFRAGFVRHRLELVGYFLPRR